MRIASKHQMQLFPIPNLHPLRKHLEGVGQTETPLMPKQTEFILGRAIGVFESVQSSSQRRRFIGDLRPSLPVGNENRLDRILLAPATCKLLLNRNVRHGLKAGYSHLHMHGNRCPRLDDPSAFGVHQRSDAARLRDSGHMYALQY